MKTLYRLLVPLLLALPANAADVKISDLPLSTAPSTNTFLAISDMAIPASRKYLLTNLATVTYVNAHTNIGMMVGAVSNNVASAGLLSVDATKTNGIAATSAHVISALGYTPQAQTAGTVVNTGASVANSIPRYSDTTGTNIAPTSVTISSATNLLAGTLTATNLTDSRVLVSSTGGLITNSTVTTTTLAFLDATSSIQTQMDAKVAKAGGTDNTGTLYFPFFAAGSYQQYADSNSQSTATITLDFLSTNYHVYVLTGAVTFASSNLGTNRNWSGEFWNTQATNCAVTWPSWRFVGGKTTTIDPAQTLRLFARVPLFANDTNVIAVSSQTQ